MRLAPIQEVERKRRTEPGTALLWLCVFAMTVALLAGNVRLYERKEQTRQLEQQLEQQEAELQELKQAVSGQSDLRQRAEALGLAEPDPAEIKILHVRRGMTD